MQISRLFPKRFSTRLIMMTFISGLIPIIIFMSLMNIFNDRFLTKINWAIQQGQEEQWQRSKAVLKQMAEDFVRQKALDVSLQLELYLLAHPSMTVEDLQNDPKFREIAIQPVSKTGYTAVHDSDTGINRFHRNPKVENLGPHSLSQKLPDFLAIIKASLEGRYSHGYYRMKEPNGDLRDKFMYIAPLGEKTVDGVRFSVAATTYIDEFTRSIQAAQDVSHSTTRYLITTVNDLLESFGTSGFLFMGIGVAIVLALACWVGIYFSRTITHLRKATRVVNQGDFNIRLKRTMSGDVGELIEDFNQMISQLATTTVRKEHLEASEKDLRAINAKLLKEITDRKLAEEALRESEEKYRYLVESANSIILRMDVDGNVTFFNEFAQRFFGYTEEEILGLNVVGTIVPETESTGRDLRAMIEDIGRNPDRYATNENENVCHNGRRVWIAWTNKPIYDETDAIQEVLCVGNDVTDRKRAEEAVREAYNIINRSPAVAFLWKNAEEWPVEFVSDNVNELIGYTADEFTSGKISYTQVVHPDDLERVIKEVTIFGEEEGREKFTHDPYRIVTKYGESKWLDDMTFIRRDEKGHITHYQGIVLDISERVKTENEKENLQAKLQQSHKMEAIGTLAGGIAHDFNNILGIILGNSELAMDDIPEWNPARPNLEEIRTASLRAKDVVRQLLSFARKSKLEKKPINIIPIVKESLKLLRSSIPTSIEIRQNIPKDVDTILADATQINQVLINLCTNAGHAMPDGGIIEITLENIEFDEDTAALYPELNPERYIKLTVGDTGQGISQEEIDRIFDPYFTTKDIGKGTGMGLAVVHGIVKEHKGIIKVISELGKGTTFSIFFPAVEKEVVLETKTVEELPSGNERILFIDDEQPIVNLAQKMLERLGYEVESTTSPSEALKMFRSKPNKFELVITDLTMPKMTGDKLVKEILSIRPDVPIILSTGFSEKIDEKKAKAIGAAEYIEKPLDKRDFALIVRKVLDGKEG